MIWSEAQVEAVARKMRDLHELNEMMNQPLFEEFRDSWMDDARKVLTVLDDGIDYQKAALIVSAALPGLVASGQSKRVSDREHAIRILGVTTIAVDTALGSTT